MFRNQGPRSTSVVGAFLPFLASAEQQYHDASSDLSCHAQNAAFLGVRGKGIASRTLLMPVM